KYEEEIMKNKMDVLNEKKMFFEAFGKVMCNEVSPELIDYKFPQNYKFSVNEILKHNEEFAKTYGCPFGTKMNPRRKCIL
ncbi:unnamed protein product, partial [Schistosoma turkestanicum]